MDNKVISKSFGWMFIGLLVTFLTGYIVSTNSNMLMNVMNPTSLLIIIVIEFALVIFLSARLHKMNPLTAKISFILYSFVSGLTFSSIFVLYQMASVMFVFLITAIVFAIFAVIGGTTKFDLTKLGAYLCMALLGVLLCMVLNLILNNSTLDLILSIMIILIFIGYIAYDVQNVKKLSEAGFDSDNLAIYTALQLYLDFINIFLEILKLFGRSRDN